MDIHANKPQLDELTGTYGVKREAYYSDLGRAEHLKALEVGRMVADSYQRVAYVSRRKTEHYQDGRYDAAVYNYAVGGGVIMEVSPRYRSIEDVKKRNQAAGYFYFEPATLRFFSSQVSDSIYPIEDGVRCYFVTSERNGDRPRRYSVRIAQVNGDIDTIGEFQEFKTARQAHARAKALAAGVTP
jgi:hypothetical protein